MIFLWHRQREGGTDPRQGGLLSQIALGQMSPLLACAIVNNCAQTEKESDKAFPPLPPELCIKTSFAGTGAKSSPAFNPSSVSPSSRDANTRMICTAVEGGLHHKALVGQMICRSGVDQSTARIINTEPTSRYQSAQLSRNAECPPLNHPFQKNKLYTQVSHPRRHYLQGNAFKQLSLLGQIHPKYTVIQI